MKRAFASVWVSAAVLLSSVAQGAAGDWVTSLPNNLDLEPRQLFEVLTEGDHPKVDGKKIKERGTGFAIAPNVVITAKHVTREAENFKNLASSLTEEAKIYLPSRTMLLKFPEDTTNSAEVEENPFGVVTESPFPAVDASRLDVLELSAKPLALSACEIKRGGTYYLLKFRQNGSTLTKDIKTPVAIKLTAGQSDLDRMGALRVLKHNVSADADLRPAPGDSGGPIIDEEGRVVGLISAIKGTVEVLMTPTREFFDLIPNEIKSTVACNKEVTFADLGVGDPTDTGLRAKLAAMLETVGAQAALIEALEETNAKLEERIGALETRAEDLAAADTRIIDTNKKQDVTLGDLDFRGRTVAAAIALEDRKIDADDEAQIEAIADEVVKEALKQIIGAKPVVPTVTVMDEGLAKMQEELGAPRWGFAFDADTNVPRFTASYSRQMTLPVFSLWMKLCLRPMLEFKDGVNPKKHRKHNYLSERFYIESEEIFNSGDYMTQCTDATQSDSLVRKASYAFPLLLNVEADNDSRDIFDFDAPPTRFFAYTFDQKEYEKNDWAEHTHRFIFEVEEAETGKRISCYEFAKNDEGDHEPLDAITAFLELEDPEEIAQAKASRACPTL